MTKVQAWAKEKFLDIAKRPKMWAGTREALVATIAILIDAYGGKGHLLHYDVWPTKEWGAGVPLTELGREIDDKFIERVLTSAKRHFEVQP